MFHFQNIAILEFGIWIFPILLMHLLRALLPQAFCQSHSNHVWALVRLRVRTIPPTMPETRFVINYDAADAITQTRNTNSFTPKSIIAKTMSNRADIIIFIFAQLFVVCLSSANTEVTSFLTLCSIFILKICRSIACRNQINSFVQNSFAWHFLRVHSFSIIDNSNCSNVNYLQMKLLFFNLSIFRLEKKYAINLCVATHEQW